MLEEEKNVLRPPLESAPLLVADAMAPLAVPLHFLLPNDDRRFNPVLQINNVVLVRQVYRCYEFFGVEIIVGYKLVHRVPKGRFPILPSIRMRGFCHVRSQ